MILRRMKDQLSQHKLLSLLAISQHAGVTPEVARDMLTVLINKGLVAKCMKTPACGSRCQACSTLVVELYQWLGAVK